MIKRIVVTYATKTTKKRIVAIDPGGITGFSSNHTYPNQWQESFKDHKLFYNFIIMLAECHDTIICETFDQRQKEHVMYLPIEYLAIVRLVCQMKNIELIEQSPSYGKSSFFEGDKKLRHLGLYRPGKKYEHAMDALRHRLQYENSIGLFDINSLRGL